MVRGGMCVVEGEERMPNEIDRQRRGLRLGVGCGASPMSLKGYAAGSVFSFAFECQFRAQRQRGRRRVWSCWLLRMEDNGPEDGGEGLGIGS